MIPELEDRPVVRPPASLKGESEDERWQRERHLNELAILRQCLDDRDRKIEQLEQRIALLDSLMERWSVEPRRTQSLTPRVGPVGPVPRRWRTR